MERKNIHLHRDPVVEEIEDEILERERSIFDFGNLEENFPLESKENKNPSSQQE